MSHSVRSAAIAAAILCVAPLGSRAQEAAPLDPRHVAFFEREIRPILVEHCYSCHGEEAAEGGLRLDSAAATLRGGDSGPAIIPGDARRSLLMAAVRHEANVKPMPPEDAGEKLSEAQIEALKLWIVRGAPDPRKERGKGERRDELYDSLKTWWAFQPRTEPQVPAGIAGWSDRPIDRFVSQAWLDRGLQSAPPADAVTLLRRIYVDLTGLPPTIPQANRFGETVAADGLDAAYATLVDELLASPEYAAHWGRRWLDVARYAESSGREVNANYPHAWRYRNWVIEAVGADMPYDDFLRRQIAGDLMPAKTEADAAANVIATGFLAVGSRSLNEMNPQQFAVDQADEQIDAVFQATMGLTLACARCHDHKFDPISQRDYTAVAGIFLSTETCYGTVGRNNNSRNISTLIPLPSDIGLPVLQRPMGERQWAANQERLTELQEEIAELRRIALRARGGNADVTGNAQQKRRELQYKTVELARLQMELSGFDEEGKPVPQAMGVRDKPQRSQQPRLVAKFRRNANRVVFDSLTDSPFYSRGEISLAGPEVPRSVPTMFLDSKSFEIPETQSGRLELARWITHPKNPMTARVAANRVWGHLMGNPLVESVDNFGTSGSMPSHPELLDHLAGELIRGGWSQKGLIRQIVLSKTYRLSSRDVPASSASDPENEFFWRASVKRLPAEAIRDSMLQAAGLLDPAIQAGSEIAKAGDGPVRPADAAAARRPLRARRGVEPPKPQINPVRSVFVAFPRDESHELFDLFDAPDGSVVQGRRDVTNVPSQSLYMLNSPEVQRYSEEVATAALEGIDPADDRSEAVERVFRRILVRRPTAAEHAAASELIDQLRGDSAAGYASLAKALFATAEFRYVE